MQILKFQRCELPWVVLLDSKTEAVTIERDRFVNVGRTAAAAEGDSNMASGSGSRRGGSAMLRDDREEARLRAFRGSRVRPAAGTNSGDEADCTAWKSTRAQPRVELQRSEQNHSDTCLLRNRPYLQ